MVLWIVFINKQLVHSENAALKITRVMLNITLFQSFLTSGEADKQQGRESPPPGKLNVKTGTQLAYISILVFFCFIFTFIGALFDDLGF